MKYFISLSLIIAVSFTIFSFSPPKADPPSKKLVKWYTWEEAIAANQKVKKKLFVDVYTDWCGWCKRMDANTFENPKVADYLNEHFYPIKFNAEQKEDIEFDGKVFKWVEAGRRGVHLLAYALLDGKMSYPTTVFLTENIERVAVAPGYKDVDQFMKELQFTAEEHYKDKSWQEFMAGK